METAIAALCAALVCILYLLLELFRTARFNRRLLNPLKHAVQREPAHLSNRRIRTHYAELYKYRSAYSQLTREELGYRLLALRAMEASPLLWQSAAEVALSALFPAAAFGLGIAAAVQEPAFSWFVWLLAGIAFGIVVSLFAAFRLHRRSKLNMHLLLAEDALRANGPQLLTAYESF
ncbi:hypothetical protein [Paenibacillus cymbidii]|uniref:hypothetical protein n=1 Tax=Paenibacillus cymbidii TaxID=1639034 RepID=UPI001081785D|nr:hypothetical protein [Paenibacillus cymbidii]